jgi:DNA-directed RNA polymerase subunit RPC12/RpoP
MTQCDNNACPNCRMKIVVEKTTIENSYGQIPMEEFIQKINRANDRLSRLNFSPALEETIIANFNCDKLEIKFIAKCSTCGFTYTFTHEENTNDILLLTKLES